MDPIRRLIFFALLASVVMAEPTHSRPLTAAMIADVERPTLVPGSWIGRLSTLLRRSVRSAAQLGPRRRRRLIDVVRPRVPSVAIVRSHATFAAHAFRLPPPLVPAV